MIYSGEINKSGGGNKLKVKIPLFGEELYEVYGFVSIPGVDYSVLNSGTNVYVSLLNNDLSQPVIVGVNITTPLKEFPLTTPKAGEEASMSSHNVASTDVVFDSMSINTSLRLPEDTTFGEPTENGDNKLITQKDLDDALTNILNKLKEEINNI